MAEKYIVNLTKEEHQQLLSLIAKGKTSSRTFKRAHILLLADVGHPDEVVAQMLHVGESTVHRTRQKFVEGGVEFALRESPRPGVKRKLDGKGEALLVATACSAAPEGQQRWTMQLLAQRLVEIQLVESISDETVRRTLKKNEIKPWLKEQWCIPEVGADFVWRMEDVLELYGKPYEPDYPQVCIDERPCQLISEVRTPLPSEPGKPERYDYEYKREGTCNLFACFQPLVGWRHIQVTQQRTSQDFAHFLKYLVDVLFPLAVMIRLVLDNLNTHTPAALYQTFEPAEARRILSKLEFHYTPKHGSWLNMVEIELSVLSRQCLNRRIPDLDTMKREISAWENQRNAVQATVNWRFSVTDARVKLTDLYPCVNLS
ncbi:MAG TPA: IS630 family transposase [Stenomitos sp.]